MTDDLKEKLIALANELMKLPHAERVAALSFLMQQITSGGRLPEIGG